MKTVYVGLSGGVDSSVAAALLKQQGYNVVGVYMKNWTQDVAGVACPWKQDLADARAAAAVLDIPFKIFDFQAEYRQKVVDEMVAEYQAGRTPNPDVMCNQEIKFKLFLQTALAEGADCIATGHYAQVNNGKLLLAIDNKKDQTYFLYRISHEALKKTIFPLGKLHKTEVRKLAAKVGLPTAIKPDSQGICFVGEVGIKAFLNQYVVAEPGTIVLRRSGEVIGRHDGAIFYTIGQRHGLGVGGGQPYYVVGKDMTQNVVYVTDKPADLELSGDSFKLEQAHWLDSAPEAGQTYQVRIRHRGELVKATLELEGKHWQVKLAQPERAISPGQSAVVYDGERVLGGGLIV